MGFFIKDEYEDLNFEYQGKLRKRSSDFNERAGRLGNVEKKTSIVDKVMECEREGLPVSFVSVNLSDDDANINDLFEDFRLRPSDGTFTDVQNNSLTFVLTGTDWSEKFEFVKRVQKHLAEKGLKLDEDWKFDGSPVTYGNDKQYFEDILAGKRQYNPDEEVYLSRENLPLNKVVEIMESAYKNPLAIELLKRIKVLHSNVELPPGTMESNYISFSDGSHYLSEFKETVEKKGQTLPLDKKSIAVIIENNLPAQIEAGYDTSKEAMVCKVK